MNRAKALAWCTLWVTAAACNSSRTRAAAADPPRVEPAARADETDASPFPAVAVVAHGVEADREFATDDEVRVAQSTLALTLPDEHPPWVIERRLALLDAGDRASITIAGTASPWIPGTRIAARSGWGELVMLAPDRTRYRVMRGDDARLWFVGTPARERTSLGFRRTDRTVVAVRGALSMVLTSEAGDERHPLTCRMLVAMLLGGDPAAARLGCDNAGMPTHITLRARGWLALTLDRVSRATMQIGRAQLAVPPAAATSDLGLPVRGASGAFFLPDELHSPDAGVREGDITVTNQLDSEAWVFVDGVAQGWLATGATHAWASLRRTRHDVQIRSLDGLARSRRAEVGAPATIALGDDPLLER